MSAREEQPAAPVVLPTREGYDRWAEIYDGEGNPLISLEEPEVERALGPVEGLDVVDVGCGTGRHALALDARGARVTAVDFSEGMLARARQKAGPGSRIRFVQHDLARPLPVPDGSFDRVVCGLVVDHIRELAPFFRELRRVCVPQGFAVVSVMHPAMMLRGVQARFVDPVTGLETRPESQPHQVSDYVMAALASGFRLDQLSEHSVGPELARRVPRALRYLGWPMLLLLKLRP